jgi:hypothetical protein
VDQAVKSICDIMRRGNCAGIMQYLPELTWILFLCFIIEAFLPSLMPTLTQLYQTCKYLSTHGLIVPDHGFRFEKRVYARQSVFFLEGIDTFLKRASDNLQRASIP